MISITNTSAYSGLPQKDPILRVVPTETQINNLINSSAFINTSITTAFKNLLVEISNYFHGYTSIACGFKYKIPDLFFVVGFYWDLEAKQIDFSIGVQAIDKGTQIIIEDLNNFIFTKKAQNAFGYFGETWGKKANDIRGIPGSGLQKINYLVIYNLKPSNVSIILNKEPDNKRFCKIQNLLNAEPTMPKFKIVNCSNVSVNLRVKIEYKNYVKSPIYKNGGFGTAEAYDINYDGISNEKIFLNRHFINYFAWFNNGNNIPVHLDPLENWDINFDGKIRGGEVSIEYIPEPTTEIFWSETNYYIFKFHIRGVNPTYNQVKEYLTNTGYLNNYWFLIRKIRWETDSKGLAASLKFQHFVEGQDTKFSVRKLDVNGTNTVGTPKFGPPRGFGLGQIDNFGEPIKNQVPDPPAIGDTIEMEILEKKIYVNRTIDHFKIQVASDQEVWNWKMNIDRGYWILDNEKLNTTKAYIMDMRNNVISWNSKHPNDLVEIPNTVEYNTIAYSWVDTEIDSLIQYNDLFSQGNPPKFTNNKNLVIKSFFDAILIKCYNGHTGGHYLGIKLDKVTHKPILSINKLNLSGDDYVKNVSDQND